MKCDFYLWSGAGYSLDGPFSVSSDILKKNDTETAIELLATKLIEEKQHRFYLTQEQYEKMCERCGYNPDDGDMEGWIYVDGTMEGAPYPIYLRIENARIEFVA